jgi:phosphate-selective porin
VVALSLILLPAPSACAQAKEEPPAAVADTSNGDAGAEDNRVATLLDDDTTNVMHDDTTVLRTVSVLDDQSLLLFGALRLWAGGAIQYDYYNIDGIFNHVDDGTNEEGSGMRRLEATVRAQLFDWGELKAQYDLDKGIVGDLYLRWISGREITPVTVTLGNQKEPIGFDGLTGNKFGMAQEISTATNAFGTRRSLGLRLHRAFQRDAEQRKLDYFDDDTAMITASIGLFTEDIEQTNDTDLALTARVTTGREDTTSGMHIGLAATYREGNFDRISFRPEVHEANRITLARPDSNTLEIAAVEGGINEGRLLLQAEAYFANYRGRVDGYGVGGYVQLGWFVTPDIWQYNSRWGTLAPHRPSGKYSVELFTRLSNTRGDDDVLGWNDYTSLTLGSSVYFRSFRVSVNLLYGESREPIDGEDDGFAVNVRAQYLF